MKDSAWLTTVQGELIQEPGGVRTRAPSWAGPPCATDQQERLPHPGERSLRREFVEWRQASGPGSANYRISIIPNGSAGRPWQLRYPGRRIAPPTFQITPCLTSEMRPAHRVFVGRGPAPVGLHTGPGVHVSCDRGKLF